MNAQTVVVILVSSAFLWNCGGRSADGNGPVASASATISTASPTSASASLGPVTVPTVGVPLIHGIISDAQVKASLPRGLSSSALLDIERAMKMASPENRQYVRWARVPGGFVVWLQDPALKATFPTRPEGLGYRIINWKGRWYYYPLTGKLEVTPGG